MDRHSADRFRPSSIFTKRGQLEPARRVRLTTSQPFQSLHESLDTTTPGGRLVFHVFAALAEFIRELIVQGTHEGLAAARARGERIGRPPAMTEEQVRHARALLTDPENTITSIAKLLGVSRTTLYKYVPELAAGRNSLVPSTRPGLLPTAK
ncbi:recombinase family protein [Streptomyces vastus]|uniref:Resolvase/invertase-type recombinase catalytic domain-containing protein n=1 Tax=Streptomyces vastus TaxID=285451 RepID=A0ABP6DP08_9ACTN